MMFKAFLLLVIMSGNGEPRVYGIWNTDEDCQIQAKKEIARLEVLPEPAQFDKDHMNCQQVILPMPKQE